MTTPTSTHDPSSPAPLTPRSKIQAMLAAMDEEDSDELTARSKAMQPAVSPAAKSQHTNDAMSDEAEDEDDDVIAPVRPRGRIARRLQERGSPRPVSHPQRSSPAAADSPPRTVSDDDSDAHLLTSADDSDSDLPSDPNKNSRFLALVEQKREERQAKEAEARRREEERQASAKRHAMAYEREDVTDDSDDAAAGRSLTQQARPTRKASKKAMEEMHRETQRLARNMQLTHEARTRKKISKQSLLDRFSYNTSATQVPVDLLPGIKVATSSSAPASDAASPHSTPPTSPASRDPNAATKPTEVVANSPVQAMQALDDSPPPTLQPLMTQSLEETSAASATPAPFPHNLDKGKGKEAMGQLPTQKTAPPKPMKIKSRAIRVLLPPKEPSNIVDEDDDLEIVPTRSSARDTIWDRVAHEQRPESQTLLKLRILANLNGDSPHPKDKTFMNRDDLGTDLQRRARQQALQEREERVQQLKERGIIVQTTEERKKEQEDIESLLAKARGRADEIKKKEQADAKRNGTAPQNGDEIDSDEDEDWLDDEAEVELSGSADEGDEAEDETEEEDSEVDSGDEAKPAESDPVAPQANADEDIHGSQGMETHETDKEDEVVGKSRRQSRRARIVSDDEDADEELGSSVPNLPRSARKSPIPGLPMSDPAPLGLTQIFAGTMDSISSPMPLAAPGPDKETSEPDPLHFLRRLPAPSLPEFQPTMDEGIVRDSQTQKSSTRVEEAIAEFTETPIDHDQSSVPLASPTAFSENVPATQFSELPDPTQDVGFTGPAILPERFVEPPPSTIETVLLEEAPRKGRLRRRTEIHVASDESDGGSDGIETVNAFDALRKASKEKSHEVFDKTKSNAKGMVEEQAEESEDEYAGLGGASDEGSGDEGDAEVIREMLDDEAQHEDEGELAAFYADKERAQDEKQVEKLFKDLTTGNLRRKRGADYDLSDSDDDGETRRRMKQREFAKMRKALLEDENVGKIASNPKKMAFLRAIEDRDKEDDVDFLDSTPDDHTPSTDTGTSTPTTDPVSLKRKQPMDGHSDEKENRPPPNIRRVVKSSKPATLSEIRESLSSLMEGPETVVVESMPESEDEETDDPHPPQTTVSARPIIDRLALLRRASTATASSSRGFFSTSTSVSATTSVSTTERSSTGFRVPRLLRRATTSQLIASNSKDSGSIAETERMAGAEQNPIRRMGGSGKNSAINRGSISSASSVSSASSSSSSATLRGTGPAGVKSVGRKGTGKKNVGKRRGGLVAVLLASAADGW
ncbi:MAG: hypothetical protein M1838_006222 [Thelocarpon superellum]|nr:MAG: hypothetical protein M1838_006222 [Thelocarpon superellum]